MAFEQAGQFPQAVLGLGHGQAVAGHKHHPLGLLQGHGAFLGAAAGDASVGLRLLLLTGAGASAGTEGPTKQHRGEGPVHGRAHHLGEDQAGGADHGARHDQQGTAHHKAGGGGGHPGIGVEQGNHHRHVGPADRQGQADAQQQGQNRQGRQAPGLALHHHHTTGQAGQGQGDIDGVAGLALGPGRRIEPFLQLGHGHQRTAKGDRSHQHGGQHRHGRQQAHRAGQAHGPEGHQQGGHATTAVEQGHGFGHGGHGHPQGQHHPNAATDGQAAQHPGPAS